MQGQCTSEEESTVHRWLDENDIDHYPASYKEERSDKKLTKNWYRLTEQVNELKIAAYPGKRLKIRRLKVAAAIAGILLLALAATWYTTQQVKRTTTYQTTYGEVKRINLSDGTIVTLNAQSALDVPERFNKSNREVHLRGEAYFQVKHHADKPFVVHAGKLTITALGTSFDVSAFADDPEIAVALKEGKVLVKSILHQRMNTGEVMLNPGEEAVYKKNTHDLLVNRFNDKSRLAWQAQDIYFENADINEVLRKLERFYGVRFDAHLIKPRHWQLSGEYKNQTLQDVLESLCFNYNLKYRVEGQKVILYEK